MTPSETDLKQPAGESARRESPNAVHYITLLLLIGAAIAARLWCLAAKPFWFDECFSVEIARIDWRSFLHLIWWREANMSLYYLLLRAWLRFGSSPFFIRSLSALISAATLPAIYWVARMLYDRRVALIATALLAFNAYSVRYAQEARSYALFVLLATLSSGALISFLQQPSERTRSVYIVFSVLAVYAHFYALLLIAAHWLGLSLLSRSVDSPEQSYETEWRMRARQLRSSWKVIGIAVLPLLAFVAKTGAGPIRWIHRPGLHDLAEFFKNLASGDGWSLAAIVALAVVAAVAPLGKALCSKNPTWEVWRCQFLLIWFLFPILLTVLLSFARSVFLARYMIFCLPALLILAAAGLARLNRWALPPALAVTLLLGLQGVTFVYGHDFDDERDASGAATKFILSQTQPGDGILFHIAGTRIPYEFFRSLQAGTNTASPDFTRPLGPEILFPRHGARLGYLDFTGKPTEEFVRTAARNHSRIWIVLMNNGPAENPDPTTQMLTRVLPESHPSVERWQYSRVEVRLYRKQ